jgi:hypothetical protein
LKEPSGHRGINLLLCLLLCISIFSVAGLLIRVQILKIGDKGPSYRVSRGDVITLRYTHSMYGVPVVERLRVENGYFEIFSVITSDAALEYYGITSKEEQNVKGAIKEFSIPQGSVGGHTLSVGGDTIPFTALHDEHRNIRIRLVQQPLLLYFINFLWR